MAAKNGVVVCTPLECESMEEMVASMEKAKEEGADIVEVCMASMAVPCHSHVLDRIIKPRTLPAIVSFRLKSSRTSGKIGCHNTCLKVLKRALELDVEFVEMDYEVACEVDMAEYLNKRSNSRIIVSNYVNGGKHSVEKLADLIACMQATGADVIKLHICVDYITDLAPVFTVLTHCQMPLIAMAVGSKGLISQLLAPKFGGFLVYGSLGGKPVPGLPSLLSLRQVYRLEYMNMDTKVFGVISNPVAHSKGPILHNPTFRHVGYNGIYVPMLVDDIEEFFETYSSPDFAGFSVGIPHKEAAVRCCDEVHPLAKSIGAVNTIVRRPMDGKLIGYNTDCEASISAIEDALRERQVSRNEACHSTSPISGRTFVLIGAGGAGRAIAFGAKYKGARIVIFNRNYERAKSLANAVSGEALPYETLEKFRPETGAILANSSAVGMEPNSDQSPVSKEALRAYDLVFDAVYTPRITRLLKEAAEVGVPAVSGIEMFVRQALGQFRLFIGGSAPEDFMRKLVMEQF
ncbi:MATERNAL EFFECT EMBRYO ARREST 32, EMBRYO DEFECTIVE 3004 [Hibiscus trionum]|uniref:MATERNAL EFFECT EMBRYO ARREST 32, EMBRYO DEFECTIVE 3004 n=1 Tax=Hibiscus trionum TaxID=183268 RepID=A0A9W7GVW5_HIBTR|nr:MATERNAL EFFECT EMBRYO ARREST 32, EMBRYO DEFECTIVE 3004 [Hibiscus trionum]